MTLASLDLSENKLSGKCRVYMVRSTGASVVAFVAWCGVHHTKRKCVFAPFFDNLLPSVGVINRADRKPVENPFGQNPVCLFARFWERNSF